MSEEDIKKEVSEVTQDAGDATSADSAGDALESAETPQEAAADSKPNGGEASGNGEDSGVEPIEKQLNEARMEANVYKERYLRNVADFENFRKRTMREKEDTRAFAVAGIVEAFIPVLDNLELGVKSAREHHPEAKGVVDGFDMVLKQFASILEQNNVERLDPAGGDFDPNLHESLSSQPSEEVPEGKILSVSRVGYRFGKVLIRPASVIVSSGAVAAKEADEG